MTQIAANTAVTLAQALAAPDASALLTTREAVRDLVRVPQHWRVVEDIEALERESRDAVAATVVLAHLRTQEIAQLAGAVHRLRIAHPHALKIVVREVEGGLRHSQAAALLQVGANAIVEWKAGPEGLLQTIERLRAEIYARPVDTDAASALSRVSPDPLRGYLRPAPFCTAVRQIIDRGAAAGVRHSLVHLPPLLQVDPVQALAACRIDRAGDLVTADRRGVHLFLHGCRTADVTATLERLFVLPVSELFRSVGICADAGSIDDALIALQQHAAGAADLMPALKAMRPRPPAIDSTRDVAPREARAVEATTTPLPLQRLVPFTLTLRATRL